MLLHLATNTASQQHHWQEWLVDTWHEGALLKRKLSHRCEIRRDRL